MSARLAERLLHVALLASIVAVVAGQLLGQPILLGYVTSDSMSPTIDDGEGFVAVPAVVTGEVQPGDVIVYESANGELVTHRVAEVTTEGYVTRGDANPVTDQDEGHPPVRDERIVATALQLGGTVVTIPALGTAATDVGAATEIAQRWLAEAVGREPAGGGSRLAAVVLVLSVVGYALETVRDRPHRRLETRVDDLGLAPRRAAVAFALFVVLVATAAMVVPAGTGSFTVVSSDPAPDAALVAAPGESVETTYRVSNAGFVPIVSYLEPTAPGVDLEREIVAVPWRESSSVGVSITAPEATGHHERTVTERRYLHVLPRSTIDDLYGVHPWAPLVVIVAILGCCAYVLGRLLAGSDDAQTARRRMRARRRRSGLFRSDRP